MIQERSADDRPSYIGVSTRISWIEPHGLPEVASRLLHAPDGQLTPFLVPQQDEIVGRDVRGLLASRDLAARVLKPAGQRRNDLAHDFVLDREYVFDLAVVALRPKGEAAAASRSLTVTRTRLPILRALPCATYRTPSWWPTSLMSDDLVR